MPDMRLRVSNTYIHASSSLKHSMVAVVLIDYRHSTLLAAQRKIYLSLSLETIFRVLGEAELATLCPGGTPC